MRNGVWLQMCVAALVVVACGSDGDGSQPGEGTPTSRAQQVDAGVATNDCWGTVEVAGRTLPRIAAEACYVGSVVDGRVDCTTPTDLSLVPRLQDQLECGYWVDYVLEIVEPSRLELPQSCDALLDCCNSNFIQTAGWTKLFCEDTVDNIYQSQTENVGDVCVAAAHQRCEDAGVDIRAGLDGSSQRWGLCCYLTCGHDSCEN